jgi:hypothetical protein
MCLHSLFCVNIFYQEHGRKKIATPEGRDKFCDEHTNYAN